MLIFKTTALFKIRYIVHWSSLFGDVFECFVSATLTLEQVSVPNQSQHDRASEHAIHEPHFD